MNKALAPILRFLLVTLRPPATATKAEVRRAGAVLLLFGLSFLAALFLLFAAFGGETRELLLWRYLPVPFLLLGFGGVVIGAFRVVLATEPGEMSQDKRMFWGVALGCGALVLIPVLLLTAIFVIDWLSGRL